MRLRIARSKAGSGETRYPFFPDLTHPRPGIECFSLTFDASRTRSLSLSLCLVSSNSSERTRLLAHLTISAALRMKLFRAQGLDRVYGRESVRPSARTRGAKE